MYVMDHSKIKQKPNRPYSITVTLVVTVMLILSGGCKKVKNEVINSFEDAADMPTLKSYDVTTLISDSGITRYRITTKEWLMFEKAQEPYWYFPQGIYVEKFDSVFATEAFIKGDTAIFYKNKQMWELNGNVQMENLQGEKFATEQLFWDQRAKRIFSDVFIHIEKQDKIIEGYGFESNEPMTKYAIRKSQGIFPLKSAEQQNPDSAAVATTPQEDHKKQEIKP